MGEFPETQLALKGGLGGVSPQVCGQGLSCTELLTTICALNIDFEIDIVIMKNEYSWVFRLPLKKQNI